MSEQTEVKAPVENNSIEAKISNIVSKLEKKEFTVYFYAPSLNHASGGMGVLFKQAKILKEGGYDVKVIYEPRKNDQVSYKFSMAAKERIDAYTRLNPTWLDFDVSDIEFLPQMGADETGAPITDITYDDGTKGKASNIQLNAEDMVIIPEGAAGVMRQLANSPCKKVVLAQSWIYILNSLQPGQTWQSFGVTDVISISDGITEYINSVMPGLNIKQYAQSINRDIFNVPEKLSDKAPMIAFSCTRGEETRMKTYNIIRNFQQWHPRNKFVRFIELSNLSREEYAERLKSCSLLLYTDDIAGFGTAPLEAMACGTHVVGWAPHGGKEYIKNDNGYWANNGDVFQLSELLGVAVDKLLNGELDNEDIQKSYESTLDSYTQEKESDKVLGIFEQYTSERISEIKELNNTTK